MRIRVLVRDVDERRVHSARGLLALAQAEALDLAGGGLRQLGHELEVARILERRELVLDERLELVLQRDLLRLPGFSTTYALVRVSPSAST
jgi:hypothetical protein